MFPLQNAAEQGDSSPTASSRRSTPSIRFRRIPRQKVRISRQKLLSSAVKVMDLYGTAKSMLEIEYFDEVGTGLGPTLEFYALVSQEFQRNTLHMWRASSYANDTPSITAATNGLFPRPMDPSTVDTRHGRRVLKYFTTLGRFIAKAIYDGRVTDLPLHTVFLKRLFGHPVALDLQTLTAVDEALGKSLAHFVPVLREKHAIDHDASLVSVLPFDHTHMHLPLT